MSLSRSHIESLERHVVVHEERLTLLREQLKNSSLESDPNQKGDPNPKPPLPTRIGINRDVLDREIRFHEHLIELARDPKVLSALKDLTENRDFVRWAAQDPRGVAEKLGINVPAGLTLRVSGENDRVRLRIVSHDSLYPFMVTWDSESGFSPVLEQASAQRGA